MKSLSFLIMCVFVIGCERSSNSHPTEEAKDSLITDINDFSVQQALHQDSIYEETLLTLKVDEKMTEEDAVKFLKTMINSNLLPAPQIIYYDNEGKLQMKQVSFEEFRKYIAIVRSKNNL